MNLTFRGFLNGYCRELTGLETSSLRKLLAAVLEDAPSAAEAVMVYAAAQGKAEYLCKLAEGTRVEESYKSFVKKLEASDNLQDCLFANSTEQRFKKVWLAYLSKKEAIKADRRVIALMREKTLEALRGANVTVYALCNQLGLNRGNVYAYLNGGDASKVSRQTARRIMEAALTACAANAMNEASATLAS